MKLLLFDIDGTILTTGGAGRVAMTQAFENLTGVKNGMEGISLHGRTDGAIFASACENAGIEPTEALHEDFIRRYIELLTHEITLERPGRQLMPGIRELLQSLQKEPRLCLALLTGNYQQGAMLKLGAFGLDQYFGFGAFGDDNSNRNLLVPYATRRYAEKYGSLPNPHDVWIIGDTPADIQCARPHGARVLAVATGGYTRQQLAEHQPDHLFDSLEDRDAFKAAIGF